MISYEDCAGLCGLSKAEIAAIAEHEHVPEMVATTLAQYLLHKDKGAQEICGMIADDVRAALDAGNIAHAAALMAALRHFCHTHPEAEAGTRRHG
ncbi:MAG TPA: hypothetical protein VHC39_01165 [Rhizomicrobium sp.]|nr:hypothetical protein [Rhizomicrobium sp.]